MKKVYILHYALGFSPYRTGGLTKFVMDLMKYQDSIGIKVALLWPGRFLFGKTRIKNGVFGKFASREIINPLPVSLLNGIQNDTLYTKPADIEIYEKFLIKEKPAIIHIHTLEGLHLEFLIAAKKLNIKLIYTTHDFFGVCPINSLYSHGRLCDISCEDCAKCNANAYSMFKIRVMQSLLYRSLKNTALLRSLRKRIRKDSQAVTKTDKHYSCDYQKLRDYYLKFFDLFDVIHCNSSITYNVFEKIVKKEKLFICNITHLGIIDARLTRRRVLDKLKISFGFLGGETISKGFYFLIDILDEIYKERKDFSLVVYSQDNNIQRDYIEKHGPYAYSQLVDIYNSIDILLVPSLWYETFGYVVLESFSFGVPSLLTDTVGAKDIIIDGKTGIVTSKQDFKDKIISILNNKEVLVEISKNIKESDFVLSMDKMNTTIYKKLL